jgi:pimeloyl-ACP methyl ester carboxylesterase
LCLATLALSAAAAPVAGAPTQPCRLKGVEHAAQCGHLVRALDPAEPQGRKIDLHFAVLPALARHKKPDPVFFLAGGPGQSAIELAGPVGRMLARLGNRRDIVLIDQRGTGLSAPLECEEQAPTSALAEQIDPALQARRLSACRQMLMRLPHGDLRHFTTTIAAADVDAVRQALGAAQANLVAASYGTRLALEVMRLFPATVRRAVLDGVAPPDMMLPQASAADTQATFDALFAACKAEAACKGRYPMLRDDWHGLLASLPRTVILAQPLTGKAETVLLSRDMLFALVRVALYAPIIASALPAAIHRASLGDFTPLVGLSSAVGGGRTGAVAQGMHFSVICSEDVPRMSKAPPTPDFGAGLAPLYHEVCRDWPRGSVPAAFYSLPNAQSATLLLSGGLDPVTPPRHAERVAGSLGLLARHEVVPNAGHGLLSLGCVRDVVFHFIDAPTDAEALQVKADCARDIPRPPAFVPLGAALPQ